MRKITAFLIAAVFIFTGSASAQELVVGGSVVGIKMRTDGVLVSAVQSVEAENGKFSPAEDAGIKAGDIITAIGADKISSAQDFINAVNALDGSKVSVTVNRAGKARQFNVTPVKSTDGTFKLGLALRDGVSGIGTLTFFDPETGIYGALGHSISDSETGLALPLADGNIYDAEIVSIEPGKVGEPGYLDGCTNEAEVLGDIRINCACGIYGTAQFEGDTLETGQIQEGRATIYCTLSGSDVKEYEIEIERVFENSELKTAQLKVTDPALLEQTGGIVQGMSGSPVIQNGKLVGAVTHVFVNDPTSGYAVSIQDMLETAAQCDKAA